MLSHLSGLICLFEAEPHYVALADKHHAVQTKLTGKSQIPACPCLPSAGNKGLCHRTQQFLKLFIFNVFIGLLTICKYTMCAVPMETRKQNQIL